MIDEQIENKNRPRLFTILLLLGMLFGFLLGFLLHDTLVEHNQIARDIKSWYPR